MNFQIPGKTFLVGEYSALVGGAALGLATAPYFKLNYNVDVQVQYHPESAAGLFLKNKNINVNIEDEYLNNNVRGGFGKSTAEYFSVIIPDIIKSKKHFSDIHSEYKKLFINENVKPSGADLAFQYFGQICLADSAIQFYQTLSWHFENLDFFIISTGLKLPTHEHIKSLNLNDLKKLVPISNQVIEAFVQNKEFEFLSLMKQWVVTLKENNLTHENSINMCNELEKFPAIKLAKPCGALGADVILIFFAKTQKNDVEAFLNQSKYNIQAGSEQLSGGLLNQLDKYWSECVD